MVIELKDLNGKAKLGGLPLYVQVQKEGEISLQTSVLFSVVQDVGCNICCSLRGFYLMDTHTHILAPAMQVTRRATLSVAPWKLKAFVWL